jgi:hypothetical protein
LRRSSGRYRSASSYVILDHLLTGGGLICDRTTVSSRPAKLGVGLDWCRARKSARGRQLKRAAKLQLQLSNRALLLASRENYRDSYRGPYYRQYGGYGGYGGGMAGVRRDAVTPHTGRIASRPCHGEVWLRAVLGRGSLMIAFSAQNRWLNCSRPGT